MPRIWFSRGHILSKAYGVIRRFSEDVDLTYDIRAIAGDLVGYDEAPLPDNRSQEQKWSREIRARLAKWVAGEITPRLAQDIKQQSLPASVRAEDSKVFIDYVPLAAGTGYVAATVVLEFGARSTGEPCQTRFIECDAAPYLPMLVFPTATPQVMRAERTFWEKATAIHVFCAQGAFRGGDRFARHWHDLARLDTAGFADAAIANRMIGKAVADHKRIFFTEKSRRGELIDYHAAIAGGLQLVPENGALATLASDYQRMVSDGLLLDDAEPFEALLQRCQVIQIKVNSPPYLDSRAAPVYQ
ncbi:MAG: nucleotidyl transferase AbiEii/AbiGii toxin family protein [Noviherbaspirillum sp.]